MQCTTSNLLVHNFCTKLEVNQSKENEYCYFGVIVHCSFYFPLNEEIHLVFLNKWAFHKKNTVLEYSKTTLQVVLKLPRCRFFCTRVTYIFLKAVSISNILYTFTLLLLRLALRQRNNRVSKVLLLFSSNPFTFKRFRDSQQQFCFQLYPGSVAYYLHPGKTSRGHNYGPYCWSTGL